MSLDIPRKPLPYYPFYVNDFDESNRVLAMNLAEVGLYVLCLNESWKRGSIPDDPKAVAKMIRRDQSQVRKAWPAIRACYEENGANGRLVNQRQEKERIKAEKLVSTERVKRHRERKGNTLETVSETVLERIGNAFSSKIDLDLEKEKPPSPLAVALRETSSRIHSRHPAIRRCSLSIVESKLKTIAKPVSGVTEKVIILNYIDSQHEKFCASEEWQKEGGQYAKGLENWLAPSKRRWDVEAPELFEEEDPEEGNRRHAATRGLKGEPWI